MHSTHSCTVMPDRTIRLTKRTVDALVPNGKDTVAVESGTWRMRSASDDIVTSTVRSDCYRLERQFPGGIRTR